MDHRAGFRADRVLAKTTGDVPPPSGRSGDIALLGLSLALVLLMFGAVAGGIYLIGAVRTTPAILAGLLLFLAAYLLRPRLGRLRKRLHDAWRLDAATAPALHALVNEVSDRAGAPRPNVILLDLTANAGADIVGLRRTRVLSLGLPLLLALTGPQLVALIAHETGHFLYRDTRRALLQQPARTVFGAVSAATRPPRGDAGDHGLTGVHALAYIALQLLAGTVSMLFFAIHCGVHIISARERRAAEIRADMLAARVAGTAATLELLDTLAVLPHLMRHIQPNVESGHAASRWRGLLASVREDQQDRLPIHRQLSIRQSASLLGSHPAPGRRYQRLNRMSFHPPALTLRPADVERIEAELAPYGEALRKRIDPTGDLAGD